MIKKVEIKNFRNISFLEIELDNATVISGKNELGKSNVLNAVMWILTDTILTDKWGSGENDIDSIVPKGAIKGINPEVAIYLESGTKFSKKYVSKWSKDGSRVTGHTTEYYVNDVVCKNETEFTSTLYPLLSYTPKLRTKDVDELRLFIDPLYALQKLDAKALRTLLVDLGCSVSDEELYQMGFEDLRPYGDKFLGKWDVFRKNLKDNIQIVTKDIESLQAKLETVSSIETYDEVKMRELNAKLEALISKKANINANNQNPEISELETKIAVLNNTIQNKQMNHINDINTKRNNLMVKRQNTLDKLNNEANLKTAPILEEISKLVNEINALETNIKAYQIAINNNSSMIQTYVQLGTNNKNKKAELAVKLDVTRNSKFSDMIRCPICGSEFPSSDEALYKFEQHKLEEIDKITEEIRKCEDENILFKNKYEECKKLKEDAQKQIDEASNKLIELRENKSKLDLQVSNIKSEPIDMSEIEMIDQEIQWLGLDKPNIENETKELTELNLKLNALKNANSLNVQEEINALDIEIANVKEAISSETILKSKNAEKLEYETRLKNTIANLNDTESLLARCNSFIQTMISLINKKATEKTGLTFVMLERNLSNDGIKEVCYATIDEIPFKDVNTAKKLKYGIKFIEKLKELLSHNELPVLADRMEGIDSFDTIKSLTKEQLICTRVSSEEVITIR